MTDGIAQVGRRRGRSHLAGERQGLDGLHTQSFGGGKIHAAGEGGQVDDHALRLELLQLLFGGAEKLQIQEIGMAGSGRGQVQFPVKGKIQPGIAALGFGAAGEEKGLVP